jgi:hypothetical protein
MRSRIGSWRCPRPSRRAGQRDRDGQADDEHHQAQKAQSASEPVGNTLERVEAAENSASLVIGSVANTEIY